MIIPGLRLSMQALDQGTSKLSSVEITRPDECLGRTTSASIQSGLYWGHVGLIREIRNRIGLECFGASEPVVVGTGGFAGLLADTGLFSDVHPDLVLEGISIAQEMNQ